MQFHHGMLLYMSGVSGKNSLGKIVPLPYGVSTYCKVYFKPHSFGMFLKLGLLMGKRLSFYLFPPFEMNPLGVMIMLHFIYLVLHSLRAMTFLYFGVIFRILHIISIQ